VHAFLPPEAAVNADLQKLPSDRRHVLFEARFPSAYPASPFMLRVIWPRCVPYTGHVTVGGTVCLEPLTPSGWRSTMTFENIVRVALFEMVNTQAGNALRLDVAHASADQMEYDLGEATEALDRLILRHGWQAPASVSSSSSTTTTSLDEDTVEAASLAVPPPPSRFCTNGATLSKWDGEDAYTLVSDVNDMILASAERSMHDGDSALYAVVDDPGSVSSVSERRHLRLVCPADRAYWNAPRIAFQLLWFDSDDDMVTIKLEDGRGRLFSLDLRTRARDADVVSWPSTVSPDDIWNMPALMMAVGNIVRTLTRTLPDLDAERMARATVERMSVAIESAPSGILSLPGKMVCVDPEADIEEQRAHLLNMGMAPSPLPVGTKLKPARVLRRFLWTFATQVASFVARPVCMCAICGSLVDKAALSPSLRDDLALSSGGIIGPCARQLCRHAHLNSKALPRGLRPLCGDAAARRALLFLLRLALTTATAATSSSSALNVPPANTTRPTDASALPLPDVKDLERALGVIVDGLKHDSSDVFSPSDYGDEEIRRRKQENALDECDQTVVRTIWNVRESLGIRLSPCRQEDVADIVGPEAVAYMQQKSGGPMIYAVRGMTPLRAAFEDRRRIQKQQKVSEARVSREYGRQLAVDPALRHPPDVRHQVSIVRKRLRQRYLR